MSVFLYNEQPLVTLPFCWLKQPTSDTEGWRGKARRRSTSRLPVEHTRSHLDTLTNSADKVFWSNPSNRCWRHSYFHQNKTKKETGCLFMETAEVLQKCGLLLAVAGLKTHSKSCFLLFILTCQRTTVLWDEPGTQKQHTRSDGAFFVQCVGSHLHVSLRSPPPTQRELARRAPGGEKHRRHGAHNQNEG